MAFDWRSILGPKPDAPPEKPGTSAGDRAMIGLGGLGAALARDGRPNPVVAVLQKQKAEEEERARQLAARMMTPPGMPRSS